MVQLGYTIEAAAGSLRESPGLTLLTTATIGSALVVLGGYVAGVQNLERLALSWGRTTAVSAYLADGTDPEEWSALAESIEGVAGVESATVVAPGEAMERFRARGPEAAELIEGIPDDVLPASIEIDMASEFADLHQVASAAEMIARLPGVVEVDYGQDEFERLAALLEFLRIIGVAVGLMVVATTAFIISNTIRLTVFARRDEIQILSLVGATHRFVRAPFLMEGALWGLAGGLLAAGTLGLADRLAAPRITDAVANILGGMQIVLFTPASGSAVIATGVVLGVLGSSRAVRRFLIGSETH